MAEFNSVTKLTKNQIPVKIRSANIQDAEQIIFVSKSVVAEDIFHLTTESEFSKTLDQQEKSIKSFSDQHDKLFLVAEILTNEQRIKRIFAQTSVYSIAFWT